MPPEIKDLKKGGKNIDGKSAADTKKDIEKYDVESESDELYDEEEKEEEDFEEFKAKQENKLPECDIGFCFLKSKKSLASVFGGTDGTRCGGVSALKKIPCRYPDFLKEKKVSDFYKFCHDVKVVVYDAAAKKENFITSTKEEMRLVLPNHGDRPGMCVFHKKYMSSYAQYLKSNPKAPAYPAMLPAVANEFLEEHTV